MLRAAALFSLLGASLVAGQSTALEAWLLRGENGSYVGSVVSVHKSLTTLVVDCKDKDDCGWIYAGATITQGPTTLSMQYTNTGGQISTQNARCEFNTAQNRNEAVCFESRVLSSKSTSAYTVEGRIQDFYKEKLRTVVITAGADKLPTDATGLITIAPTETSSTTTSSKNAAAAVTAHAVLAGAAAVISAVAL